MNDKSKMNFVKTSDIETRDKLIALNYEMVSKDSGVYTFLNKTNTKLDFENNKVTYSNMLTF